VTVTESPVPVTGRVRVTGKPSRPRSDRHSDRDRLRRGRGRRRLSDSESDSESGSGLDSPGRVELLAAAGHGLRDTRARRLGHPSLGCPASST
jgi:hypothetical protein